MKLYLTSALLGLSLGGLGGCQASEKGPAADAGASEAARPAMIGATAASGPETVSISLSAAGSPVSCADEIGATAADKQVKMCLAVSPATHPPCNTANSCAMIEDEIARSCALFDGQGAPMAECRPVPKSQAAAVAVVKRYYSALNAHDYDTAWQQWGEGGPPNQTRAKFSSGFAHTRATHVTIGVLEPSEGGAGSIYQNVPVVVDATLDDGTHQRFTGEYVVRRVNDVDGAAPAQLRWHIGSAKLAAAPAG
ncbi:hypothetical protein [Asticcacaulis benevestitus]|uniref:Lipoprotein n=1 Tax=Asticcacaulis benevestitus DSM 16100 = ATCC BAA-896 TaxID=1121022 RepID=V4R4S6_9CAUL|nr:hypothetical protein [Asticcacaulis benevestitus]ESQ86483.1 hypothetical protein ABENE_18340 [Asticcacaulis benevestitus DSM 16100 = ATCC BAA-896]